MIDVRNLSKSYRVHKRVPGLTTALQSVLHRKYEDVKAVEEANAKLVSGDSQFLFKLGEEKTVGANSRVLLSDRRSLSSSPSRYHTAEDWGVVSGSIVDSTHTPGDSSNSRNDSGNTLSSSIDSRVSVGTRTMMHP